MTKRLLLVAALLLALAVSANAWTGVYCARVTGDTGAVPNLQPWFTYVGAVGNSGAYGTAPGVPANTFGLYTAANVNVVGLRTMTYSVGLPTAGYYEAFITWATTTNAPTSVKHIVTEAGGATSNYFINQLATKNVWAGLGVHKFNANDAANTKITVSNEGQTAGSIYVHSVKFESVTPGAVGYGIANGASLDLGDLMDLGLSWTAGQYAMAYDLWFGEDPNAMTKLIGNYNGLGFGLDPEAIAGGKTYFWRVDSINVDKTTQGELRSFSTNAIPEPGSMLALATGFVGLFGIIRRKRS
ncbi:MAG: PEP-CTERM sorting domain-containing protein [Armatimonadota bacterium]